jgi:hypothetical protein
MGRIAAEIDEVEIHRFGSEIIPLFAKRYTKTHTQTIFA